MPFTAASMATVPYNFTPLQRGDGPLAGCPAAQYRLYAQVGMSRTVPAPRAGRATTVTFNAPGAGPNTCFLPWLQDGLTCMIIPALVAAAPAITAVTTANLHGCAVFIERRSTGDIVLYHVNADTSLYGGRNVNPPPAVVNRHPAFQTGDAIVKLMHLYNTARTSPALPGVTQDVRALFKAEYFQPVQAEIARKRHQGRKITELPVEVASVAGFYNAAAAGGPAWEFYCQTWLSLSYKRPAFSAKSFFWINTKRASNLNNVKVVGGAPLIVSYH